MRAGGAKVSAVFRSSILAHIEEHAQGWVSVFSFLYALVLRDRIGHVKSDGGSDAVPGIWGHSFVRTYYRWIDKSADAAVQREGGITSTYFVLRALKGYLGRFHRELPQSLENDLATFFLERTKNSGIGIRTVDDRGNERVQTNLRHTCFGFMTMQELSVQGPRRDALERARERATQTLLRPMTREDLAECWLTDDQWPVGGIASYIAARDVLFASPKLCQRYEDERRVWPGVRDRLIDLLASISSADIARERGGHTTSEHLPFWHPIGGLPTFRLHSTNGCLALLGRDLYAHARGRTRIHEIVAALRNEIRGTPSFVSNGPASLTAAAAMLEIVLADWYEPTSADVEFTKGIMDFVLEYWSDTTVYGDFWTEFTAPLLNLDAFHSAIGSRLEAAIEAGVRLAQRPKGEFVNVLFAALGPQGQDALVRRAIKQP